MAGDGSSDEDIAHVLNTGTFRRYGRENKSMGLNGTEQSFWTASNMDNLFVTTPRYNNVSWIDDDPNSTSSSANATEEERFYHFYQKEQLTFLCVEFAFILIGNLAVLIAILLSKNRKSRMNFFIMQLAIADLSTGLVTVLTDIIWKTTVEWHAGNLGCKVVRFFQSVATFSSTYVLVALSIDRLDAIARPMHFSGSARRARMLVVAAWALSVVFSLPMGILNHERLIKGIKQCWISMPRRWHWKLYVSMLAALLFVIPAIIIAGCYAVIVVIIWSKGSFRATQAKPKFAWRFSKKNAPAACGTDAPSTRSQRRPDSGQSSCGVIPRARIKTVKMTLVIVLAFVLSWCPYFIFDLMDVYGHIPLSQRKIAIAVFIQSLATLNSATNPIIYCLFSTRICSNWRRISFCDRLNRLFCWWCSPAEDLRRPQSTNGVTEFSSLATNVNSRGHCSRVPVSKRRNSSTPYVRSTLTDQDNDILLRHVNSAGGTSMPSTTQCYNNVEAVPDSIECLHSCKDYIEPIQISEEF